MPAGRELRHRSAHGAVVAALRSLQRSPPRTTGADIPKNAGTAGAQLPRGAWRDPRRTRTHACGRATDSATSRCRRRAPHAY